MLRRAVRLTAGVILTCALVAQARGHLHSQCSSFFWVDPEGGMHETENCIVPGTPSYGWQIYAEDSNPDLTQCYDYRPPYCEYADNPADPPPDACGDERDNIIAEYVNQGVGFRPFCSSFTQSVPTQSQYVFGSPRQTGTWSVDDDYHWAVLQPNVTSDISCVVTTWGATPSMTSGYRNPNRNAALSDAVNSRHVYGDAADLQTELSPNDSTYDQLKTIAKSGACATACVEPRNISTNHFHADYRQGGCPSNW
jgi:hypothetical protein